jgi:hypothetical protein
VERRINREESKKVIRGAIEKGWIMTEEEIAGLVKDITVAVEKYLRQFSRR